MSAANQRFLKDLRTMIDPGDLNSLINKYNNDPSKMIMSATDAYSTKTSFETNKSIGLRRPQGLMSRASRRTQSPSPGLQNFSKTFIPGGSSKDIVNKQRAVFYGDKAQIPNLYAQDVISSYYNRQDSANNEFGDTNNNSQNSESEYPIIFKCVNRKLSLAELSGLKELQLYYCQIESLRSLGTGWRLKALTVIGGQLADFSGITGFAVLEDLFVSYNKISDLSHLIYNQTIKSLDLQGNCLDDYTQIQYIQTIENLKYLRLAYNPILEEGNNRQSISSKFARNLDQEYIRQWGTDDEVYQAMEYYGYNSIQTIQRLQVQDWGYCGLEDIAFYDDIIASLKNRATSSESPAAYTVCSSWIGDPDEEPDFQLTEILSYHRSKPMSNKQSLEYLEGKACAEEYNVGSSSRSKPKLSEIRSREKLNLVKAISSKEQNSSTMGESALTQTGKSFRQTIRAEARKKFLVRKGSMVKRDSESINPNTPQNNVLLSSTGCNQFELSESIRIRPNRNIFRDLSRTGGGAFGQV